MNVSEDYSLPSDCLPTKYLEELKKNITKCMLTNRPDISFDDIAGNQYAKDAISEAFILPEKFPKLFSDQVKPW